MPLVPGSRSFPSLSVIVVSSLIRHNHSAALKMFSNSVMVISAGFLGYTAGLGVPRMEVDFFGAEHIQPRFSPFQPYQDGLMRRDGSCESGLHPCKCYCTGDETLDSHWTRDPVSDIKSTTICCPNTDYCMVNETTLEAQCCVLGSTCGSSCGPNEYYSVVTTT